MMTGDRVRGGGVAGGPSATAASSRAPDAARRVLEERIRTLATPELARRVLDEAIRTAAVVVVPSDGLGLTRFVDGPLFASIERALGRDAADAIVHDLAHLLRVLCTPVDALDASHVRLSARPETTSRRQTSVAAPAAPTPVAPTNLELVRTTGSARMSTPTERSPSSGSPARLESQQFEAAALLEQPSLRVVLASASDERERALGAALGAGALVTRVEDVFDLVDHSCAEGPSAIFVVLDAAYASVRATTLAAATTELGPGTVVVLWGASEAESMDLGAIAPEASQWKRLARDTSVAELVRYLRTAVA